jgi:hypothetical protein
MGRRNEGGPLAGDIRSAAEFALCAEIRCNSNADLEVLHVPGDDGSQGWVPLCQRHYDAAALTGLEYVVETHGFVRPALDGGAS